MASIEDSPDGEELAAPAPTPPRRGPGHRGQDVRDTMAEMAAKAHEISLEAGSRMAGTMREVIGAAAGLTAFAIESARDLVQYMVRRGQMSQDEADKLMREVEAAHATLPKPAPKAEPAKAAPVAKVTVDADAISLAPPVVPRPPRVAAPEPVRAPKVPGKADKASAPAKASPKAEKASTPKVEATRSSKAADKSKPGSAPAAKAPAKASTKAPAKVAAKPPAKSVVAKAPAAKKPLAKKK